MAAMTIEEAVEHITDAADYAIAPPMSHADAIEVLDEVVSNLRSLLVAMREEAGQ